MSELFGRGGAKAEGAAANALNGLRSGTTLGELPSTGVQRFDELVVGTNKYQRWVSNLERRGFEVVEKNLGPGNAAFTLPEKIVQVDPARFRYIDLLHESRHVAQIERAAQKGITDAFTKRRIAMFECGAYEYELRLGNEVGFSEEYMNFASQRVRDCWNRGIANKFRFRPSFQQEFRELWR